MPWVGLGSAILAVDYEVWRNIKSLQMENPHKFRKLSDIVEHVGNLETNKFCKRWSVGAHLQTAKTFIQVIITTYHSMCQL